MVMDRRAFLRLSAGGLALSALPLGACTTDGPSIVEHGGGAIAIAADGTRYQLVPERHHLVITAPGGSPRRVGSLGREPGQLNYPAAVTTIGALAYVVDLGNHRVQAFDGDGRCQAILGDGELVYPSGITARGDRLFVANTSQGHIVELALGGGVVRRFGHETLAAPRGLATIDEHLLVADPGRRQVLELRDDGSIVRVFGGEWVLPYGVASDGDAVYVADRARSELAVFDRRGKRIETVPLTLAASYLTLAGDGQLFVG
jgi:DNA-binding beta-propeller fold protein YncE